MSVERVEQLENVRLSLLRQLRDRAQVLGKNSVLYYGLSSLQAQQLNEYAGRLRNEKTISTSYGSHNNFAGLKKQLRDATSTITILRKQLKSTTQENVDTQRLLGSGRWGNPGYLNNSYDSTNNGTLLSSFQNQNIMPPRDRRSRRPRKASDIETSDELSSLRLTCERLKTELGLPAEFQYDDLDTYSKSEVESVKAGMEELERQNEALEAERTATVFANQNLQRQQAALQSTLDQMLSNSNSNSNSNGNSNSRDNTTTTTTEASHRDIHEYQSRCFTLQGELNRVHTTVQKLQLREGRANKMMASQQRTSNELMNCMTEL